MPYVQEQQFAVSVTIDGTPISGLFDKFEGGEVDSDADVYRAGGMAEPEALPGPVTTGEVTIGRGYRGERDAPLERWLAGKVGRPIVIGRQALNPDKTPVVGGLLTFGGVVKGYATPSHDSQGNAVAMLEITATIGGLPS